MTTFVAGSRSRAGAAACRVALGETGAETTGAERTGEETTGAETTGAETTGAETTGAETTGAETSVDGAGGDFRSRSVFFAFARPRAGDACLRKRTLAVGRSFAAGAEAVACSVVGCSVVAGA